MNRPIKLSSWLSVLACLALLAVWAGFRVPPVYADHCSRGEGTLSGPAIGGVVPSGKALWQGTSFCQPLEFSVEVSKVNLPDGTILSVAACGPAGTANIVGSISLRGGSGKLQLSKLDGDPTNDNVPFCDMRFGGSVRVLQGSTITLSGCVSNRNIPGAPAC
jgi:hypothetical protein